MIKRLFAFVIVALLTGSAVHATETVTYTYGAKGRLVRVVRTGTPGASIRSDRRERLSSMLGVGMNGRRAIGYTLR